MNILILGCGFLGYNLTIGFQESDYQIITVDKNLIKTKFSKHYTANIKRGISKILKKEKPEVVYLLVNESHINADNIFYFLNLDLYDIVKVIKDCIDNGVKKFITISSFDISHDSCEDCNSFNKYELPALDPRNINRFSLELYLQYFKKNYNIDFVSLRVSNVYGFKKFPFWQSNIVYDIIKKSLKEKTMTIDEHEENMINLLYVGDVISALILSLREEISGIYNVIGQYHKYIDILKIVNRFVPAKVTFTNKQRKYKYKKGFRINSLEQHSWSSIVSLQAGVNATFNHIIKQNDYF